MKFYFTASAFGRDVDVSCRLLVYWLPTLVRGRTVSCVGGLVLAVLLNLVLSRNCHLTGERSVHRLFPVYRGLVLRPNCAPEKSGRK
jgi:hypothetical protein